MKGGGSFGGGGKLGRWGGGLGRWVDRFGGGGWLVLG